jgi:hypothetical protein
MPSMRRLFVRCNGGHYFHGPGCPFDGWGGPEGVAALFAIESACHDEGRELTLDDVRAVATEKGLLQRVLIIEHADTSAEFEALAPEYFIACGEMWTLATCGLDFM